MMLKSMLSLLCALCKIGMYGGFFLLLYTDYKLAKAHDIDELSKKLLPSFKGINKQNKTAVLCWAVKTLAVTLPAICFHLIGKVLRFAKSMLSSVKIPSLKTAVFSFIEKTVEKADKILFPNGFGSNAAKGTNKA